MTKMPSYMPDDISRSEMFGFIVIIILEHPPLVKVMIETFEAGKTKAVFPVPDTILFSRRP